MAARAAALTTLLLLPFAACTTLHRGDERPYRRDVALPADLAAALAAAALRQQFPFADPFATAAGAPAHQSGAGFTIVFEQSGDGAWLPVGDHRLRIVAAPGSPTVVIEARRLDERHRLLSLDGGAAHRIVVAIEPADHAAATSACRVTGSLPANVASQVAAVMDRTFALASDDRAPLLGLSEPNLRAFVRHRLLHAADEHLGAGRPRLAAERLHTANRFVDGDAAFQRALAVRASRAGDVDFAREQLLQALLVTADPAARADLAREIAALHGVAETTALTGDAAESWLHTTRRQQPEPVRDYRRLALVHAERRDAMGELACALLAREHEPAARLANDGAGLRRLPFDLALRVQESRPTLFEVVASPPAPLDAVAAPAR